MRVALVIPPVKDFYFTPQRASFLGVHTIAEILSASGTGCRVFNGTQAKGKTIPLPGELSYLSPFMGREAFFKSYKRFGPENAALVRTIREYHPDWIFISCFAFCYALEAMELIRDLKAVMPGIPLAAGGAGATVYPEYFLRNSPCDFVFAGEADEAIMRFLENPADAPNTYRRCGAGITPPSSISVPDHFAPVMVKTNETRDKIFYSTMISRGCSRKCTFCSVRLVFPEYRKAIPGDIDGMFCRLKGSAKRPHINFEDDNLEFESLAEALDILWFYTEGNYSFSMENGMEFRSLTPERIGTLAEYNIRQFNFSLVSADRELLKECGRDYSPELFTDIATHAESLSLPVIAYLISGMKGDTVNSLYESVAFLSELPVLTGISTFYPVPGTRNYEERSFFDGISPRLCAGSSFYPWNQCSTDDLVGVFLHARRLSLAKRKIAATTLAWPGLS